MNIKHLAEISDVSSVAQDTVPEPLVTVPQALVSVGVMAPTPTQSVAECKPKRTYTLKRQPQRLNAARKTAPKRRLLPLGTPVQVNRQLGVIVFAQTHVDKTDPTDTTLVHQVPLRSVLYGVRLVRAARLLKPVAEPTLEVFVPRHKQTVKLFADEFRVLTKPELNRALRRLGISQWPQP